MEATPKIQLFWINMDRSVDRRNSMENMLSSVESNFVFHDIQCRERVSAVDARECMSREGFFIKDEDRGDNYRTGTLEYACLFSHFLALSRFVESSVFRVKEDPVEEDPVGLILEDDMTLAFSEAWKYMLPKKKCCPLHWLMEVAPPDWEILQLCYICPPGMRAELPEVLFEKIQWDNTNCLFSTGAYLIRRSAAKRILETFTCPGGTPWGCRMNLSAMNAANVHHEADHFLYSHATTYCVRRPVFIYSYGETSTIHSGHQRMHDASRHRIETQIMKKQPKSNCSCPCFCFCFFYLNACPKAVR